MDRKVYQAIKKYGMLKQGGGVVVGVSGGVDSVALLDFLCRLRVDETYRPRIVACHVNHGLRGEESDRDARFVGALCERLGVRLRIFTEDIAALASRTGKSVEEAARMRRYERFMQVLREENGSCAATAHTLSDSMETALFNFARGTSLRGLRGIPPVRGPIVRPLILVTRREVEEYCVRRGLEYVTDSTNLTDQYARNRIRHRAVPALQSVNPCAEEAFARLSDSLSLTQDYIERQARRLMRDSRSGADGVYDARRLAAEHPAVLRTALAILLEEDGAAVSFAQVERLERVLTAKGPDSDRKTAEEFTEGRRWRVEREKLFFEAVPWRAPEKEAERGADELTVFPDRSVLPDRTVIQFHGKNFCFLYEDYEHYKESENNDRTHLKNVADYDKIKGAVVMRVRREGDRFSLPGRNWTKSLKKLMNEYRIPPADRRNLAVCADEEGVFWAEGFGVHARVAAGARTKIALVIRRTATDDMGSGRDRREDGGSQNEK